MIAIRLGRREVVLCGRALSNPDMRSVVGVDITAPCLLKHIFDEPLNVWERPFLDSTERP